MSCQIHCWDAVRGMLNVEPALWRTKSSLHPSQESETRCVPDRAPQQEATSSSSSSSGEGTRDERHACSAEALKWRLCPHPVFMFSVSNEHLPALPLVFCNYPKTETAEAFSILFLGLCLHSEKHVLSRFLRGSTAYMTKVNKHCRNSYWMTYSFQLRTWRCTKKRPLCCYYTIKLYSLIT